MGSGAEPVRRGELGAGAEVWYQGTVCRLISIGGAGTLLFGDEGQVAVGHERASLCLGGSNGKGTEVKLIELTHSLDWDRKPTLFMPRSVLRRRYRQQKIEGLWGGISHSEDGKQWLYGIEMRPHFTLSSQNPETGQIEQSAWGLDFLMIGWRGTNEDESLREVEVMKIDLLSFDSDAGGAFVTTLQFLSLENFEVGHGFFLDGALSRQQGSNGALAPNQAVAEEQADNRVMWGGRAAVRWSDDAVAAGAVVSRDIEPTFTGRLAKDTRVESHVTARYQFLEATARAFFARTVTVARPVDNQPNEVDYTGGVGLDLILNWRFAQFSFSNELARSFYTRFDDDPTPSAALGFQAFVRMSVLFGERMAPTRAR